MRIILGSNSPRRKELLKGLDIDFVVDTDNNFNEIIDNSLSPYQIPLDLSKGKSFGFHRALEDDEILITADTIVLCEGKVLGKPHSRVEAVEMLKLLAGRCHEVITGVYIRSNTKQSTFSDITKVWFTPLTSEEIEYYIDKYKPFDKAGSYAIQEWIGYASIYKIEGSFYNVMGFPVHRVREELKNFNYNL